MICKNCKTEITSENKTKAYVSLCKFCAASLKREEYQNNKDKKLANVKKYQASERGKEIAKGVNKRMYSKYPERQKGRARFRYAIRVGKIVIPKKCNYETGEGTHKGRLEAHHYDGYEGNNALKAIWLCKKHHVEVHKEE